MRAAAIALTDPLFAFESAAILHGLPVFGEPLHVHVFVEITGHSYRHGDVLSHTGVDGRSEVRIDGMRVTSLVDTVVDLIGVLPLAFGVAVVDAALRLGAGIDELEDRLRTQRNTRGRARAREALRRADGAAESAFESVSRVVIELLGFETPELQKRFWIDGRERRPDFYWPSVRVTGDADGDAKYFMDDDPDQKLRDQRRRDLELQSVVDRTLHWEWRDVMSPPRLERILTDAGVPRTRPADPHLRAALANRSRTRRTRRARRG